MEPYSPEGVLQVVQHSNELIFTSCKQQNVISEDDGKKRLSARPSYPRGLSISPLQEKWGNVKVERSGEDFC